MKKKIKRLVAIVCAAMVTVMLATAASASDTTTVMGRTYKTTSGGSGGKVQIVAEIFKRVYEPAGGVHAYYYGNCSKINSKDSLLTTFNITGTLYTSSSHMAISKSGTAKSVTAQYSSGNSTNFTFCASNTKTSSSAFGSSTQECNFPFK